MDKIIELVKSWKEYAEQADVKINYSDRSRSYDLEGMKNIALAKKLELENKIIEHILSSIPALSTKHKLTAEQAYNLVETQFPSSLLVLVDAGETVDRLFNLWATKRLPSGELPYNSEIVQMFNKFLVDSTVQVAQQLRVDSPYIYNEVKNHAVFNNDEDAKNHLIYILSQDFIKPKLSFFLTEKIKKNILGSLQKIQDLDELPNNFILFLNNNVLNLSYNGIAIKSVDELIGHKKESHHTKKRNK